MSEILDLAQQFKQKSSETAALIETTLQDDLEKLHVSFMKSLTESETIIKQGTKSLDDKKTKLTKSLETHHKAINTIFSEHITSLQTLMTESLDEQEIEITKMMNTYSEELKTTMQNHQANAFDFVERRTWVVFTFGLMFSLLVMMLGVIIGMKLG